MKLMYENIYNGLSGEKDHERINPRTILLSNNKTKGCACLNCSIIHSIAASGVFKENALNFHHILLSMRRKHI